MIDHREIPEPDAEGTRWYGDGARIIPDSLGWLAFRGDGTQLKHDRRHGVFVEIEAAAEALPGQGRLFDEAGPREPLGPPQKPPRIAHDESPGLAAIRGASTTRERHRRGLGPGPGRD